MRRHRRLGPLVGLLWILPTGAYIKLLVVVFTAAGLAGTFFLLRDLAVAPPVAALAAVRLRLQRLLRRPRLRGTPLGDGGTAPARPALPLPAGRPRKRPRTSIAAAVLNAFTIGGGQHQPFIWQNLLLSLFAAAWAIQLRSLFPLWKWGLVLLLTAGLGAVKLLPMVAEFAEYAPSQRTPGLPLGLLWSSVSRRWPASGALAAGAGAGPRRRVVGVRLLRRAPRRDRPASGRGGRSPVLAPDRHRELLLRVRHRLARPAGLARRLATATSISRSCARSVRPRGSSSSPSSRS